MTRTGNQGKDATNQRLECNAAGFTLIEVLATLLLTGLLVSSMMTITGQWLGGWNRGAARLERVESLAVTIDRLALDIQSVIALPAIGRDAVPTFAGDGNGLMFVHPSIDPGAPAGLEIVRFYKSRDGILLRARAAYDPQVQLQKATVGEAVIVSRDTAGIAFAYMGKEGQYSSEWSQAQPPTAVRATIPSPAGAGRPDLIVSFPVHASVPAVCARARGYRVCEALASGQSGGQPANPANAQRPPNLPGGNP